MKTILLLIFLIFQPAQYRVITFVEPDHKAINELHAKQAVYDEDSSNAIIIQDQYDTLLIKYPMNELNEIDYPMYPVIYKIKTH